MARARKKKHKGAGRTGVGRDGQASEYFDGERGRRGKLGHERADCRKKAHDERVAQQQGGVAKAVSDAAASAFVPSTGALPAAGPGLARLPARPGRARPGGRSKRGLL